MWDLWRRIFFFLFGPENFEHQIKKLHAVNLHLRYTIRKLKLRTQGTQFSVLAAPESSLVGCDEPVDER